MSSMSELLRHYSYQLKQLKHFSVIKTTPKSLGGTFPPYLHFFSFFFASVHRKLTLEFFPIGTWKLAHQ